MQQRSAFPEGFVLKKGKPLILLPDTEDGNEVVRLFDDEFAARSAITDESILKALGAIGSWSDLDEDAVLDELDRMRQ